MDEVNDLAGQHEVVAENLQANVIKELSALVKDLREERKVSIFNLIQIQNTDIHFIYRDSCLKDPD